MDLCVVGFVAWFVRSVEAWSCFKLPGRGQGRCRSHGLRNSSLPRQFVLSSVGWSFTNFLWKKGMCATWALKTALESLGSHLVNWKWTFHHSGVLAEKPTLSFSVSAMPLGLWWLYIWFTETELCLPKRRSQYGFCSMVVLVSVLVCGFGEGELSRRWGRIWHRSLPPGE